MAYNRPTYPAPEHYALYEDLTGVAFADRDRSKAWWGMITSEPYSHTKSLFNEETHIHSRYNLILYGSSFGLKLNGWKLLGVFETKQWYSEIEFQLADPAGKGGYVKLEELRQLGITEKRSEGTPYTVYYVALGVQLLRKICILADWTHYASLPKLRTEKLALEKGVAELQAEAADNKVKLAAKIKTLRNKAKLADQRLAAKLLKIQAEVAAVSAQLPIET